MARALLYEGLAAFVGVVVLTYLYARSQKVGTPKGYHLASKEGRRQRRPEGKVTEDNYKSSKVPDNVDVIQV